jgi:periplasmic protein TonB
MQIAGWHWLAASVAAVGAHAAIGWALLVEPPASSVGGFGGSVTEIVFDTGIASQAGTVAPVRSQASAQPMAAARADRKAEQAAKSVASEITSADLLAVQSAGLAKTAAVRSEIQMDAPPPPPRRNKPQPKETQSGDTARAPVRAAALSRQSDGPSSAIEALAGSAGDSPPAQASEGGEEAAKSAYVSALQAWLLRHKQYPDRALARRQQGTVTVSFVVNRMGQVREYRLEQSSGHRLLDQEAAALVQRAVPMPRLPASMPSHELPVIVPIEFAVR